MPAKTSPRPDRVRVWDLFVRTAHWIIVAAFFTAYFAGNEYMTVHEYAGYTVAALVFLRLIWGFTGSKFARFSNFVRGPRQTIGYLKDLFQGKAKRHLGHNPAGAAMIVALLISLTGTTLSGMALLGEKEQRGPLAAAFANQTATGMENLGEGTVSDEPAGDSLEGIHKTFMYLTLVLAAFHVLGVAASSHAHKENLVRAMLTGDKAPSGNREN